MSRDVAGKTVEPVEQNADAWLVVIARLAFLVVVGAGYARLYFGFDFSDESYYVSLPYAFHLGHRPLIDELAIHQLAGLVLWPWVELYLGVESSTDGLVLFLRHSYFACSLGCALITARYFRSIVGPAVGLLIGAVSLAYVPFAISNLSYNTVASLALLASLLLTLGAAESRRPLARIASGAFLASICTFVYPTLVVATAPGLIAAALIVWRQRQDLSPTPILVSIVVPSGALLLAAATWLWLSGGPAVVERAIALNDALGSQGGGEEKLLTLLRELRIQQWFLAALAAVLFYCAYLLRTTASSAVLIGLVSLTAPALLMAARYKELWTEPQTTTPYILSVLALGALPLLIFRSRRELPRRQREQLFVIASVSTVAGLCILWSTANGLRNAALGLLPAALVALSQICSPRPTESAPSGWVSAQRLACVIFLVSILGIMVSNNWLHVYRDDSIPLLSSRVESGPWKGIRTTPRRSSWLRELVHDLEAVSQGAESILFFDYFPAGYLLSDLRPSTSALWMFPATQGQQGTAAARAVYAERFGRRDDMPDLVVRMDAWEYRHRLPRDPDDPVKAIFSTPEYQVVLQRPWYEILKRMPRSTDSARIGRSDDESARPNLILISIDTLRADHVGAYGYARPTTPSIDSLAEEAVRFETCIAQAPTTLASHGSILTSLVPVHHGASITRESGLAAGVTTLAEALGDAGYQTASFNGGIQLDAVYGLDRGFDHYESVLAWDSEAPTLSGPENRMRETASRALSWLDGTKTPFFLFLHSYEIHHPYNPEERHLGIFGSGYTGKLGNEVGVDFLMDVNAGRKTLAEGDLEHIVDLYDAELRSADEALGQLFAELRSRGLYDDTMIIVTSDHGEEFGEHGNVGWHSHTLYDELIQVPLIVKYPDSRHAGRVVTTQVRSIDVAPTALAGLGVPIPSTFTGVNLEWDASKILRRTLAAVSMLDGRAGLPIWAIRAYPWKAVAPSWHQLFDLRRDPGESSNLVNQSSAEYEALEFMAGTFLDERPYAPVTPIDPSDFTRQQLRSLGYIE